MSREHEISIRSAKGGYILVYPDPWPIPKEHIYTDLEEVLMTIAKQLEGLNTTIEVSRKEEC